MLRPRHALPASTRPCCWKRGFQASYVKHTSHETVSVPCASNGSISLDVYPPDQKQTPEGAINVAIFLPRGPVCRDEAVDAANVAQLRSALPCHVVQINYRCSSLNQYPTPVHDVATGLDWIVSNLLPKRATMRAGRSEHVGKLAVCGELIGGQLATMLALTECRIGEPGIVVAAVNNPIVNWVSLDEDGLTLAQRMKMSAAKTSKGLTLEAILKQRASLFRKAEHYHDPFVSPILFFRTSGYEVAEDVEESSMDELDELAQLERDEYLSELRPLQPVPEITNPETLTSTHGTRVRTRKSSRRFPSKNLGLRLPRFSLTAGNDSPILGQAAEMTKLLEQSFARQNKSKAASGLPSEADSSMVQFHQYPGLGLWDHTSVGRARMLEVAKRMVDGLAR